MANLAAAFTCLGSGTCSSLAGHRMIPGRPTRGSRPLPNEIRHRINEALIRAGLDGNGNFREIGDGIATLINVLNTFGIEQDEVLNAHRFSGNSGRAQIDLAWSNPADPFSPEPIANTAAWISWYRRESGNFEILAYLG